MKRLNEQKSAKYNKQTLLNSISLMERTKELSHQQHIAKTILENNASLLQSGIEEKKHLSTSRQDEVEIMLQKLKQFKIKNSYRIQIIMTHITKLTQTK